MEREEKHTPGPWVAEDSEIFAAAGDAVRIAETVPLAGDPQDVPGFGRMELANARLIAAAPDLYEALARISRMKLFPDDQINRTTLASAIHIAVSALSALTNKEGSSQSQPVFGSVPSPTREAEPSAEGGEA